MIEQRDIYDSYIKVINNATNSVLLVTAVETMRVEIKDVNYKYSRDKIRELLTKDNKQSNCINNKP